MRPKPLMPTRTVMRGGSFHRRTSPADPSRRPQSDSDAAGPAQRSSAPENRDPGGTRGGRSRRSSRAVARVPARASSSKRTTSQPTAPQAPVAGLVAALARGRRRATTSDRARRRRRTAGPRQVEVDRLAGRRAPAGAGAPASGRPARSMRATRSSSSPLCAGRVPARRLLQPGRPSAARRPTRAPDQLEVVAGVVGRHQALVPDVLGRPLEAVLVELPGQAEQHAQRRRRRGSRPRRTPRRAPRRSSSCARRRIQRRQRQTGVAARR